MKGQTHAARQEALYRSIWEQDPGYGTRQVDVEDTVLHRIIPHMRHRGVLQDLAPTVIDFGAGDGRFLRSLRAAGGLFWGIGVDVNEPKDLPKWLAWRRQVLWAPVPDTADYAISTDTLEHMPTELVTWVMGNISRAAPHGFLRIATKQDIYGTERGLHLHETVQEPHWWLQQCGKVGIEPTSWRVYPGQAVEIWW